MRRTVLALVAALAAVAVSGCTSAPPDARSPVTVTVTAAPTTAGPAAVTASPASTVAGPGVDPGFGSGLRLDGDRLTYERLTWYTGDAADAYCHQVRPTAQCQMEYEVADQHTLGSGTVDAATRIVLLAQTSVGIEPVESTRTALAAAVKDPQWSPFWRIQVSGGRITLVEHVYVP